MKQKIIFLDIDGPIIPQSLFFLDKDVSQLRSFMDTNALGYVVALAKGVDAKIVTNSQHNQHEVSGQDLKADLIDWGVPEKLFHEDWRTDFHHYPFQNRGRRTYLEQWLTEHDYSIDSDDWICFDDIDFTSRKNLILIDDRCGITYKDYVNACKFWDTPTLI